MHAWQHGIELDVLSELVAPFRAHDAGLILGAFSAVNEARIAEWASKARLRSTSTGVVLAGRVLQRPTTVKDFRGVAVCTLPTNTTLVDRLGYLAEAERDAEETLRTLAEMATAINGGPFAVWLWQEHAGDRRIAERLGLRLLAVKIRASSEIVGLYGSTVLEPALPPPRDLLGLCRLNVPQIDVAPLCAALDALGPAWAPHYSSYSEKGTWKALALRGFSDDPLFIEKPTEMSKKWKADHPEHLGVPCRDTELRWQLPEAEPLIAAIPGPKQRIRLMRLDATGGLARHADITDPEAGCAEGLVLRIHIPLRTSGAVTFRSWRPTGIVDEANMREGEAWYLDTRKPHAARNAGDDERIHLVIDAVGSTPLLELLPA